jgi:hypothetical protein
MGFRVFHSFNLAMLAKQLWRLIDEPESLCALVAGSSFMWQSILDGLATSKRGYIWRVRNGESTNIYDDPWISSSTNRRIVSPSGEVFYTKVADLIDLVTGQWDEVLHPSIFFSVDVNRILEIPLNTQEFDDFVSWNFTKHGRYTVRLGYYLQWKHKFGPAAGQLSLSRGSINNLVRRSLWHLKIPRNVKIFVWRSLHGIVPLKSILVNRHIGLRGQCRICTQGPAHVDYLLFQCPTSQELWRYLGHAKMIQEASIVDHSGSAVLEQLLRQQTKVMPCFQDIGLKETISAACWYMWWIRQHRTHDENVPPMFKCMMSILAITTNSAKGNEHTYFCSG